MEGGAIGATADSSDGRRPVFAGRPGRMSALLLGIASRSPIRPTAGPFPLFEASLLLCASSAVRSRGVGSCVSKRYRAGFPPLARAYCLS